ncbi:Autophagy protein 22 [Dissophora globulifera]|nr:Autophagy protein 22 [Dissophora globulifera]
MNPKRNNIGDVDLTVITDPTCPRSYSTDTPTSDPPSSALTVTENNIEVHPLTLSSDRKYIFESKADRGLRPDPSQPHNLHNDALLSSRDAKIVPLKRSEVWAWDVAAIGGVEASNHAIPCDTSVADYKCVRRVFGDTYLDPGTISLYVSSLSAIVSFIVSLSIAAVADHGSYRKSLLVVFAILGCLASVAFFFVRDGSMLALAVVLAPLGWACHNVSSVFSNAFLPIYARAHPDVLEAAERVEVQKTLLQMDETNRSMIQSGTVSTHSYSNNSSNPDLNDTSTSHSSAPKGATQLGNVLEPTATDVEALTSATTEYRKVEEQVSNDLSARCMGAANVGAIIVQLTCIGISEGMNNSLLSLQIAIAFTGVWWLGWTIAVMPWLEARPGPPMPKGRNWIAYSWGQNYKTLKSMRKLSQITKFIFAWFMLSDGVNTLGALLYVITYQDLHFTHTKSIIMAVSISVAAFVGVYIFLYIRQYWKLSTKSMVGLTLGLYVLLTTYFVLPTYFTKSFGLRHEWEAWVAIVYLGLIISSFYSVSRVMMAELCPEGDENEWFSLFQLADKGSSWIGPFVTGGIQSITGEFRAGFWFPLALFAAGGLLLWSVDMSKGKDEAIAYKQDKAAKHQLLRSIPPITVTAAGEHSRRTSQQDLMWL